METVETVFVLGAGASMPYGFPSGFQLFKSIADLTKSSSSHKDISEFKRLDVDTSALIDFARSLIDSGLTSVDAFLEHNYIKYAGIGKTCIAYYLLNHEKRNGLRNIDNKEDWYRHLFGKLAADKTHEEFVESSIGFITFNYDRSLEQFLWTALQNAYGLEKSEAKEIYDQIPIVHLHGALGSLPYSDLMDIRKAVPYGGVFENSQIHPMCLRNACASIKIIHEEVVDTDEFSQAHHLLKHARNIYVTGFSFHQKSVQRLNLFSYGAGKMGNSAPKFLGTTLGLSPTDKTSITKMNSSGVHIPWLNGVNARQYECNTLDFLRTHVVL